MKGKGFIRFWKSEDGSSVLAKIGREGAILPPHKKGKVVFPERGFMPCIGVNYFGEFEDKGRFYIFRPTAQVEYVRLCGKCSAPVERGAVDWINKINPQVEIVSHTADCIVIRAGDTTCPDCLAALREERKKARRAALLEFFRTHKDAFRALAVLSREFLPPSEFPAFPDILRGVREKEQGLSIPSLGSPTERYIVRSGEIIGVEKELVGVCRDIDANWEDCPPSRWEFYPYPEPRRDERAEKIWRAWEGYQHARKETELLNAKVRKMNARRAQEMGINIKEIKQFVSELSAHLGENPYDVPSHPLTIWAWDIIGRII